MARNFLRPAGRIAGAFALATMLSACIGPGGHHGPRGYGYGGHHHQGSHYSSYQPRHNRGGTIFSGGRYQRDGGFHPGN